MSVILQAQKVGGGSAEWQTPPDLYTRLNRRFRFDHDAFASHENALCDRYSTADGTFHRVPGVGVFPGQFKGAREPDKLSSADGLTYDWTGLRIFMNPPFTRGFIEQAVEKAYNERENAEIIVALLPAATETRWFREFVLSYCHIDWLPQRVRFTHPPFECSAECQTRGKPHRLGEPGDSPTIGHVIAVFKSALL